MPVAEVFAPGNPDARDVIEAASRIFLGVPRTMEQRPLQPSRLISLSDLPDRLAREADQRSNCRSARARTTVRTSCRPPLNNASIPDGQRQL